ncbi:MAG: hypothetical protein ACIAQZ_02730 [Sedimentisphaeraceae bacterium JB056]
MRCLFLLLAAGMVLVGCQYEAPLSQPQGLEIDRGLIGSWLQSSDEVKEGKQPASVLVFEFTEKEYLISYSEDDQILYFRGYPVELAGEPYLQMQLLGTAETPVGSDDRKYHLAKYDFDTEMMEFSLLNTDVVDKTITDSDELKEMFLKNKDNKQLFSESSVFLRQMPEK